MLQRYHSESSSLSLHDTWPRKSGRESQIKAKSISRYVPDIPPSTTLPRPIFGTIRNYPTSTLLPSHSKQFGYINDNHPQSIHRQQHNDFRYNIPLQERFHQPATLNLP